MDIAALQKAVIAQFLQCLLHTVHSHGEFWRFRDGQWKEVPLHTIRAELLTLVEGVRGVPASFRRRLVVTLPDRLRIETAFAVEGWNRHPALLPCRNGVLDLTTGQLASHDVKRYLLRTLGVNYDPAAQAPAWDAFIAGSAQGAAGFLQEFAGLSLTFDTRHETAVWLHGPPGSGKSTFLRGLEIMLGDRAGVLDLPALERGRLSPAALFGRSLLLSSEQPVAGFKRDHLLNALISGEPLPIDLPRQLPGSLRTSAKWVWALTRLPLLSYAGSGLFRRIRIVNFPPRALAHRDPGLKTALEHEGPGILNWALAGLARLQARGRFEPPPDIRAADECYLLANDLVAQFVAEQAHPDPTGRVPASALYSAYCRWCRANGHLPLSGKSLAADWERLGFTRRRIHGRSVWHGLELAGSSRENKNES